MKLKKQLMAENKKIYIKEDHNWHHKVLKKQKCCLFFFILGLVPLFSIICKQ
jgi:hypothetical protein